MVSASHASLTFLRQMSETMIKERSFESTEEEVKATACKQEKYVIQ